HPGRCPDVEPPSGRGSSAAPVPHHARGATHRSPVHRSWLDATACHTVLPHAATEILLRFCVPGAPSAGSEGPSGTHQPPLCALAATRARVVPDHPAAMPTFHPARNDSSACLRLDGYCEVKVIGRPVAGWVKVRSIVCHHCRVRARRSASVVSDP